MNRLKSSAVRRILSAEKNIKLAFMFGSVSRGTAGAISDVDIAILLRDNISADARLDIRLCIGEKISAVLGREADIVVLNMAGSLLKYQVARDGLVLFERTEGDSKEFRLAALKEYFDYLPTFNFHYERLKARRT